MSLRANVLAAILTATAALVLALVLLEGPLVDYRQMSHGRRDLYRIGEETLEALRGGAAPDEVADRLGALRGARVSVFSLALEPLGDTAFAARRFFASGDSLGEEVLSAAEGDWAWRVRRAIDGQPTLFVALSRGQYVVRVSRPHEVGQAVRHSVRELVLAGGLIAILAAALLGLVITQTMVRPIEQLTRFADLLAEGDLTARVQIGDRRDEIGRIGRSLDHMAHQLEKQLQQAQAGEQRLRTLIDAMAEGVFVADRQGRITLSNSALDSMVANPSVGMRAKALIRNPALERAIVEARRGQKSTVEFDAVLRGKERVLQVHMTPLLAQKGVVGVVHDVTDLRRAERIRSDFVANASHELRTPLTAIRGFAETLRDASEPDAAVTQRFLDAILRHSNRLQRLVDDLLALSRAESKDQDFELGPVEVAPIVRDVVRGVEAQAGRKRVCISIETMDGLPTVLANAWALDHVIVNLVDNAVKYTPDDGQVTVRSRAEPEQVVIEVRDTGPGISAEHRSRIFERFYRVDAGRTRTEGGTGLGLAIVKHLMHRMGGTVEVDSELGKGAAFRLRLPTFAARLAASEYDGTEDDVTDGGLTGRRSE